MHRNKILKAKKQLAKTSHFSGGLCDASVVDFPHIHKVY
jgi:hypothetical protein